MVKKFFIETFGCQMNVLDSEVASARLRRLGYEATPDPDEADVLLLNTCAVRERASDKVFTRIRSIRKLRKQGSLLGVMGCVAQGESDRVLKEAGGVDLVIGTQALERLPELLAEREASARAVADVRTPNLPAFAEITPAERIRPHVAFVTIMEGCDKFCTFCIVPFTRGRERSRSPQRILSELISLREAGYQEVQLLGQNVNSYGRGRRVEGGASHSFAELLELLARESGLPRIKYTTSHPRDFNVEILEVMERHANLCNWIHLPVQSGSDRMLAAMNRGYSSDEYRRKVDLIRASERDYALTGDVIVGFPGETERDFQASLDLVNHAQFDGLYIFNYSSRPGTVAAGWHDGVPPEVKSERFERLRHLHNDIQRQRNARFVGRTLKVLVEGRSTKLQEDFTGHSTCHRVVNFSARQDLSEGRIVDVLVTEAFGHSLYGRLAGTVTG
ncbi:MAG: tRNA (N6-isopentenyl adenosine(37)-C2)-methylthiotransferase MiaB [Acidobacteria bacterium]|nr:tRNA (N6-isopentenyl adenosine(37)-C2)-methylthiotransferase MiaB [Acidobacteriota bacterium]